MTWFQYIWTCLEEIQSYLSNLWKATNFLLWENRQSMACFTMDQRKAGWNFHGSRFMRCMLLHKWIWAINHPLIVFLLFFSPMNCHKCIIWLGFASHESCFSSSNTFKSLFFFFSIYFPISVSTCPLEISNFLDDQLWKAFWWLGIKKFPCYDLILLSVAGVTVSCMRRMSWEPYLVYGRNWGRPSHGKKLRKLYGEIWTITMAFLEASICCSFGWSLSLYPHMAGRRKVKWCCFQDHMTWWSSLFYF